MHTVLYRANALLTFAGTTLAVLCVLASLTDYFHKPEPQVDLKLASVERLQRLSNGDDEVRQAGRIRVPHVHGRAGAVRQEPGRALGKLRRSDCGAEHAGRERTRAQGVRRRRGEDRRGYGVEGDARVLLLRDDRRLRLAHPEDVAPAAAAAAHHPAEAARANKKRPLPKPMSI